MQVWQQWQSTTVAPVKSTADANVAVRAYRGCTQRQIHSRGTFLIRASSAQFSRESESPASPTTWNRIVKKLRDNQVECVSSEQLIVAKNSGVHVIDVRPHKEYEAGFIEDSVNIPLYDLIEGWSPRKFVTRVGFAAFGVLNGTELNGDFFDEVENVIEPEDGVILVCGQGGALTQTSPGSRVLPTRSLIAAHELTCNGYKNVRVLRPGASGWEAEGRDMLMLVDE